MAHHPRQRTKSLLNSKRERMISITFSDAFCSPCGNYSQIQESIHYLNKKDNPTSSTSSGAINRCSGTCLLFTVAASRIKARASTKRFFVINQRVDSGKYLIHTQSILVCWKPSPVVFHTVSQQIHSIKFGRRYFLVSYVLFIFLNNISPSFTQILNSFFEKIFAFW